MKNIFIVDDDEMLSMMLGDHLSQLSGFKVHEFHTGEDCIAQMHLNPNIIILDFNLDSIKPNAANGLEILQKIRKIDNQVFVILYSSQEQYGTALKTIQNGALHYVLKDVDAFNKIYRIIENINKIARS